MTYTKELPRIKIAFTVVAFMAASLSTVGGSVSAAQTDQSKSSNSSVVAPGQHKNESQAATDLRIGLETLLQDHVRTNLTVNRLIAESAPQDQLDKALTVQEANSIAISAAIGSIYGEANGDAFLILFQEHIDASNEFAEAIAAGDQQAIALAEEELQEYLVDITNFLVTAIDVLPPETVLGLLEQHEMLINQSTEAFITQNFGQSKKVENQAIRQVAVIADALATGIITTKNL